MTNEIFVEKLKAYHKAQKELEASQLKMSQDNSANGQLVAAAQAKATTVRAAMLAETDK